MIQWVTTGARIGFVVAAMAVIVPMVTLAQMPEAAIESIPTEEDESAVTEASPTGDRTGANNNTSVQRNPPALSTSPSEVEAENQRLINELRSELLDDRADYIDRWLSVIGVVLTFFGIVVAIVGVWGFRKFQKIETEAKNILEEIKETRDKSLDIFQDLNAEAAAENPAQANQAVKNTRENPKASLVDKAIANALDLQQHGRNKEAIKKWLGLAQVATGSDNDLAARAWLSVGYLALDEDPKGSVLANDQVIRLKPDLGGAYINRGNAKQKLGQYGAAVADYDEAIRLKPDLAEAYINRGAAKQKLGQYEAAIADCNEAIRLKPDHAEAYNNRGAAKAGLGRHEAAIDDYDEAIRLKPDYAGAYSNRGVAKHELGRHEAAIDDYDEAIRLKPDYAGAYINRGVANQKLGQYEGAVADCNEAIRLKPDLAVAYNNRGAAKYELGQYEAAIADYDEAIRLKPDHAEAYSNRGEANQKLGQYEGAVADCNEAIRLKPDHAEAYINRGAAKAVLDLKDEARKDFEIALVLARKANDDAKIVAQAEQELRDLDDDAGS